VYYILVSFTCVSIVTLLGFVVVYGRKSSDLNQCKSLIDILKAKIFDLEEQFTITKKDLQLAIHEKFEAQKEAEIAKMRLVEFDKRLYDFEQNKKASLESSKAAVFEIAQQLSSKLIADHRRESQEARQNSVEKFKEATANYHKQFEQVVHSVAALNAKIQESSEVVDVVKRALLSPGGTGSLAEITLENILKSSGLIDGKDFKLQYSINNHENRQRPDAIVFLPSNNIFIIDSKASKFFLESEISDDPEIAGKLLSAMRNHLKQLVSKEYQNGVMSHLKSAGYNIVNHVSTIMFLPSESLIEKLQKLDKNFLEKAWQHNIFPAGPSGLINLLSHARFMISEQLQIANHEIIINEVKNLLSGLFVLSDSARKLGANLQSASSNFDRFAGSFNRTILSKVKRLHKLGIASQSGKQLPNELERFQVLNIKQDVIEVEAEEANNVHINAALLNEKEEV
jgi:DNA recombination protein RmuC